MKSSFSITRLLLFSFVVLLLLIAGCVAPVAVTDSTPQPAEQAGDAAAPAGELIPIAFGAIEGASQAYIPLLLQRQGIAVKYGIEVSIVPLSQVGQQWVGLRTGDFDISAGGFLDLLRQRQQGLEVKAIRGFIKFGNPIVATADKPYENLSDLAGARFGTVSTAVLDWMVIRTAGVIAYDFDVEIDAIPTTSSPPLITELLMNGELDAAWQFSDFTLAPLHEGTLKEITNVAALMGEAGLDPNAYYLTYHLADQWAAEHPDAVVKLIAAMDEAVELMMTDDSIWPELAAYSGVEDPELLPAFIEMQREAFDTEFSADKLEPTQNLLDELIAVVGPEPIGVDTVDPAAFDFESAQAAKELREQE
jgi:ABC-type nitrate/sulfonate/bicarbonate transport system substrate-binding protein